MLVQRRVRHKIASQLRHGKAVKGHILIEDLQGIPVQGYEIHCGVSLPTGETYRPFCSLGGEGRHDGMVSEDSQLIGTYIHGIFDTAAACAALLKWAGLSEPSAGAINLEEVRELQLNRFADTLRSNLSPAFLKWLQLETAGKVTFEKRRLSA